MSVIGVRLTINNTDVTSLLRSVEYGQGDVTGVGTSNLGVDAVVGTAQIVLARDDSLHALLAGDYKKVVIETSRDGGLTESWEGYTGDEVTWAGGTVTVVARDPAKILQDTQVDGITVFGSEAGTPAETVIQQVMSHHLGEAAPLLRVPVSPNALVGEFTPVDESVWDTIQGIVRRFGWLLTYQYNAGAYELTLVEPPRGGVLPPNVVTVDWSGIVDERFTTSTRDVRNRVTINFVDDDGEPQSFTKTDQNSVDNVTAGVVKASVLTLDETSGISTFGEAERLADAFLADLSSVLVNTQHVLPFRPDVGLLTELRVFNPSRVAVTNVLSVNSVRHRIAVQGDRFTARTTVLASGQVVTGKNKWLDREARPGSPADTGRHIVQLRAPDLVAGSTAGGVIADAQGYKGIGTAGIEFHVSPDAGFTPDAGTLFRRGPDTRVVIPSDVRVYVRAREFDHRGYTGPWSAEVTAEPLPGTTPGELEESNYWARFVEAWHDTWDDAAQTLADSRDFWDAAAATLDGTLVEAMVTARSANSLTDTSVDFEAEGIQPGDQVRIHDEETGAQQIRVVTAVNGSTIAVSEAFDPMPSLGTAFTVGRVTEITARTETANNELVRSEIGRVELNLNEDALDSAYSSISQTAEEARSAIQRLRSNLLRTGTVNSTTSNTVQDTNGSFIDNGILPGDVILFTDGDAKGVQMDIASVSANSLTLARDWPNNRRPDAGDSYIVGRVQSVASSGITQTSDSITSIVSDLTALEGQFGDLEGQFADLDQWFGPTPRLWSDGDDMDWSDDSPGLWQAETSLGQLGEDIRSVGLLFDNYVLLWSDNSDRVWSDGGEATSNNFPLRSRLNVDTAFSRIHQNAYSITSTVARLNATEHDVSVAFSEIRQTADDIKLTVRKDDVISSINVSPESIRLKSDRIQLASDTIVDGSFTVTGENMRVDGNATFLGNITVTGDGNTGTLLFKQGASELLALGNVSGKFGAPSGAVGIAGKLGTGAWIEGAVTFLTAGREEWRYSPTMGTLSSSNRLVTDTGAPRTILIVDLPAPRHLLFQFTSHFFYSLVSATDSNYVAQGSHTLKYRTSPSGSWLSTPDPRTFRLTNVTYLELQAQPAANAYWSNTGDSCPASARRYAYRLSWLAFEELP